MVDQSLVEQKRKREIDGLYYIAHLKNLPSILRQGILSHQQILDRSLTFEPIYNADIVSNRRLKQTPDRRSLWEYANLYFEPRNAMLYKVVNYGAERALENTVLLKVKASALEIPDAWIANGNAASVETEIIKISRTRLEAIAKQIDREYWSREDGSLRKMMAELLVPDMVPAEYIECIYVAKQEIKDRVSQSLQSELFLQAIPIIVDPYRFFQPNALIRLNPRISLAKGDMFFSRLQTLTISVNTKGVMGKGLASRAKWQFPDVFIRYQQLCQKKTLQIGKPAIVKRESSIGEELAQLAEDTGESTWFLLFPTKADWRENSKIEYIRSGMQWLLGNYKSSGIRSLAMPALGCGLGGLSWAEVGPIMCSYADKMNITACIYLPNEETVPEEHLRPEFLLREIP